MDRDSIKELSQNISSLTADIEGVRIILEKTGLVSQECRQLLIQSEADQIRMKVLLKYIEQELNRSQAVMNSEVQKFGRDQKIPEKEIEHLLSFLNKSIFTKQESILYVAKDMLGVPWL
jgi:hypothetical protein